MSLTPSFLYMIFKAGMDGPHVNWDTLKLLIEERKQKGLNTLLNLGSCGLHVVHGAFKTGMKSQDWKMEQVFRSMSGLFYKSPARRDIYLRVGDVDKFPKS